MRRYRCNTCAGEFEAVQADGLLYFHRCPPEAAPGEERGRERANFRDENVVQRERGKRADIKARGLGRRRLDPGPGDPIEED